MTMKKQQFIDELTRAIAQVDPQTKAEIMADIQEHFAEGASFGLTEEEICIKLGQPSQIAEQVLEEYNAGGQQTTHNDFTDSVGDLMGSIGDLLGSIGNYAGHSIYTEVRRVQKEAERIKNDGFGRQIDIQCDPQIRVDIRRTRDGTTRVWGGYDIDIDETFTGVNSLDVSLSSCGIKIVPIEQGETARVVIQGSSRYNNFIVENQNGRLIVADKMPLVRFEIFNFNSKLDATIYLPQSFDGNIRANSSAGGITVANLRGDLVLKASAGSIVIDNHRGATAHLRSSAGSVSVKNSAIVDIDAKSSAGGVSIETEDTHNLAVSSSAGPVRVCAGRIGGETRISSSAGAAYLEAREVAGNITAKTSAGGVHIRLPREVNCRIDVKKSSLSTVENGLVGNPQSPYVLKASASVGSVILEALS